MFGRCEDCAPGQTPRDDRVCHACSDTYVGTVSDEDVYGGLGTRCVCPTGSYSVGQSDPPSCRPCSELNARVIGVRDRYDSPVVWENSKVCPGGIPVRSGRSELPRGRVCPLSKLWIETDMSGSELALIACPSCVSGSCTNASAAQLNARCKEHHTGFLCASCEAGYKAGQSTLELFFAPSFFIRLLCHSLCFVLLLPSRLSVAGECVECIRTDWQWICVEIISAAAVGLYLMTKTWSCVADPAHAEAVFEIMDTRGGGYLSGQDVRTMLIRMGNPVAASVSFAETMAAMKAMDITAGRKCGALRAKLPRWCGGFSVDTRWAYTDSVSRREFMDWCETHQNRAVMGVSSQPILQMLVISRSLVTD